MQLLWRYIFKYLRQSKIQTHKKKLIKIRKSVSGIDKIIKNGKYKQIEFLSLSLCLYDNQIIRSSKYLKATQRERILESKKIRKITFFLREEPRRENK